METETVCCTENHTLLFIRHHLCNDINGESEESANPSIIEVFLTCFSLKPIKIYLYAHRWPVAEPQLEAKI